MGKSQISPVVFLVELWIKSPVSTNNILFMGSFKCITFSRDLFQILKLCWINFQFRIFHNLFKKSEDIGNTTFLQLPNNLSMTTFSEFNVMLNSEVYKHICVLNFLNVTSCRSAKIFKNHSFHLFIIIWDNSICNTTIPVTNEM